MLDLSNNASVILAELKKVKGFNQFEFLDSVNDFDKRPAQLPTAQLALSRTAMSGQANKGVAAENTWVVLVSGKKVDGQGGLLSLVDAVLNQLSGFSPQVGVLPLYPKEVEYVKQSGQVASYAIYFTTSQKAEYKNKGK